MAGQLLTVTLTEHKRMLNHHPVYIYIYHVLLLYTYCSTSNRTRNNLNEIDGYIINHTFVDVTV